MEHWGLSDPPLVVWVLNWWVSWENSGQVPEEKVGIVQQCSVVELSTVDNQWSLIPKSSSETFGDEEH